ncbi:MAG: gamma-glutamylcyclotransferase [Proteobacteria bacterium]|nr:MAG: gamma-glutamylcyclotransferase [Pseudomonadota bacterium]QKK12270.1 MAG: gamma-glutamylcyclotransferase [Pseudomonadota bacterium]
MVSLQTMENRSTLLFVYGTLLTGTGDAALDRLLKRCLVPLNDAVVRGRLYRLGGYPGAVPDPECQTRVPGVIVHVRHARFCWPRLDRYEDCGRLYTRERITAFALPGGVPVSCWIYRYRGRTRFRQRIRSAEYQAVRRYKSPPA